jgi:hypothetical protein
MYQTINTFNVALGQASGGVTGVGGVGGVGKKQRMPSLPSLLYTHYLERILIPPLLEIWTLGFAIYTNIKIYSGLMLNIGKFLCYK